jgi:hypothetical protein
MTGQKTLCIEATARVNAPQGRFSGNVGEATTPRPCATMTYRSPRPLWSVSLIGE